MKKPIIKYNTGILEEQWKMKGNCKKCIKVDMSGDFKSFLSFYIAFAAVVGIGYMAGKIIPISDGTINLAENCNLVQVKFTFSVILELIFAGPVFCPIAWKTYQFLWKGVAMDDTWREKWKKYMDILYMVSITLIVTGATLHSLANALHEVLKEIGQTSGVIFNTIYLWDEIISHYIIPAGFFGMLYVNTILDSRQDTTTSQIYKGEMLAAMIMGILLGGVWTYALLEGQAAWFYMFFSGATIALIVYFKHMTRNEPEKVTPRKNPVWKLVIKKNPYVLLVLVYSITNIIVIITWAIAFLPLKPCLPFLYQPNEKKGSWIIILLVTAILTGISIVYFIIGERMKKSSSDT